MRKLYLASFTFKTGDLEYNDYRIAVVSQEDRKGSEMQIQGEKMVDMDLEIAYKKLQAWFPIVYPESELLHLIIHQAIE